jgi:hypothetical protein
MSFLRGSSIYRYSEQNFVFVPAHQLRAGDMISLPGPGYTYGAAEITGVINSQGQVMVVSYVVPVGHKITSKRDVTLTVSWEGERAIIDVTQLIEAQKKVLVLK